MLVKVALAAALLTIAPGVVSTAPGHAAAPAFLISPTSFDFGAQPLHSPSASSIVTVTNVSGVAQPMNGTGGAGGLFGGAQNCQGLSLAPGDSCQMFYEFTPSRLGPTTGHATGTWNGQKYTVDFRGVGTPQFAISPTGLDFGHVPVGSTSSQQTIAITNLGSTSASMNGTGGAGGAFGGAQNCQGLPLAAGDACQVFYAFTPRGIGDTVATARGTWNAQKYSVHLHGLGTGPAADDIVPLQPSRLAGARARANRDFAVRVTGGDVPADARAVDLTVTLSGARSAGTAVVHPCGTPVTRNATVQLSSGHAVSNHVVVAPGTGGKVCVRGSTATRVDVDLDGYYPSASGFAPLPAPVRRFGLRQVAAGHTVAVPVSGRGVPGSDVRAVALDISALAPVSSGSIVVRPCGSSRPGAAALTFAGGRSQSALTVSKVGTGGAVCVRSSQAADLAVDVVGYYVTGTPLSMIAPQRTLSRTVGSGGVARSTVVGGGAHIAGDARAIVLEVSATGAGGAGALSLFPCGTPAPQATALSYPAGGTATGLAITSPGTKGQVCVRASRQAHVTMSVIAWYSARDVT